MTDLGSAHTLTSGLSHIFFSISGRPSPQIKMEKDTKKAELAKAKVEEEKPKESSSAASSSEYHPKWAASRRSQHGDPSGLAILPSTSSTSSTTSDALPSFASAANRALHEETQRLELLRKDTERALKTHRERISLMEDHLHQVRQEVAHTDGLMAAKKKEIETEEHLLALSEREDNQVEREIKRVVEETTTDKQRIQAMQTQIDSTKEETDKLKEALNWNQEELEQWAAAAARKEEDNLALQRYARADEAKIKELSLSIENLTKQSVEKRSLLDNEAKQTMSYQVELDRIADAFKAQHGERKDFIKQWQETVATMRVRDEEIGHLSKQYAQVESILEQQMSSIAKDREALAMLEIDKDELEQSVAATEREVLSERHELLSAQSSKGSFLEELDALRIEMMASSQSLQERRAEEKITRSDLEQRKIQLSEFKERHAAIKKRLEDESKATLSQERAAKDIEKQLAIRRKELKQKDQVLQALQEKLFKHSQEIDNLHKAEADLQIDIASSRSTYKNLASKIRDLEAKYSRQQEVLYNTEFDLQQMERKVARGLGERSDEEKIQLQGQIDELERDLEAQQAKRKTLAEQCKKIQVELQNWSRKKQERTKQQDIIKEELVEIELEIKACEIGLENIQKDKEDARVSHDTVKLDVRRACGTLREKSETVYDLEDRREAFKEDIRSKKEEINAQADVKTTQIRLLDEERHKAAIALNDKNATVKNLQSRHFTLKGKGGAACDDGVGGEEHSAIYQLIAAAQKKADLQREGDALEQDVLQNEREMIALTRTLQELKERNTRHRLSFKEKASGQNKSSGSGTGATPKDKAAVNNEVSLTLQQLQQNVGGNDVAKKKKKKKSNKAGVDAKRGLDGSTANLGLSLTATGIAMTY